MKFALILFLCSYTADACLEPHYFPKEFKDEYGFDYIVTGSIRASDNKLRILIELSDMTDDRVIWSNKFDRSNEDIFEIEATFNFYLLKNKETYLTQTKII